MLMRQMTRFLVVTSGALSLVAPHAGRTAAPATDYLVARGRIVSSTYQRLPARQGEINLAVLYSYRVRLTDAEQGTARQKFITVKAISDPPLRSDRDFIFRLKRQTDGTYRIAGAELAR